MRAYILKFYLKHLKHLKLKKRTYCRICFQNLSTTKSSILHSCIIITIFTLYIWYGS